MTKDQERYWTARLIELRAKEAAIGSLPRKDQRLVERIRKLLHPECDRRCDLYTRSDLKFDRYLRRARWVHGLKDSKILSPYRSKSVQRLERRRKKPVEATESAPTTTTVKCVVQDSVRITPIPCRGVIERFVDWLGDL